MATIEEAALAAAENAVARHADGLNCAQCVACSLAPEVGLDPDLAFRLMEGFGGGMGNRTQTCGAISGAVAVLSAACSGGLENPTTKSATYDRVGALVATLEAAFGGTVCCAIRPQDPDAAKVACQGYIARGALEAALAIADARKEQ